MVLYTEDGQKFFDEQLLCHIRDKDHNEVLSIIENVDVKNLVDSSGMTLLHHAVNTGDAMTVKYLIDQGCEVDAVDACGNTPLLNAIPIYKNGFLENLFGRLTGESSQLDLRVIPVLLESNADILFCGQDKRNALEMVLAPQSGYDKKTWVMFFEVLKRKCSSDSREVAKILLDNKCLLPQAIYLKDPIILECMLDAGCDINVREPDDFSSSFSVGSTALQNAISNKDVDTVKLLLERGADIYAECSIRGLTTSHHYTAGEEKSYDMLSILLDHDTTLNTSTVNGYYFASRVLRDGRLNEVELLLNRHNFDFANSTWNSRGETLLQDIVENVNREVIQILEGRKFDVNKTDNQNRTALWNAAKSCNPYGLEFLFKHGASPNHIDKCGLSALFSGSKVWALDKSNVKRILKCLELLLEHGADISILFENHKNYRIFDVALNRNKFLLTMPIIAHVAIMEATQQFIKEDVLEVLRNKRCEKYFNICRRKIEMLKKTMINGTVSLFQFLTEPEEQLLVYLRNHETVARLELIIRRERRSKIFFVKLLRKRIQSILNIAKLRVEAALSMIKISGCGNQHVIEEIILLLDKKSLQNLCGI